jgi:hypothetical protein
MGSFDEDADVNELLARCEAHLTVLRDEERLTSEAPAVFQELAKTLERRIGPADRRHRPRTADDDRRQHL